MIEDRIDPSMPAIVDYNKTKHHFNVSQKTITKNTNVFKSSQIRHHRDARLAMLSSSVDLGKHVVKGVFSNNHQTRKINAPKDLKDEINEQGYASIVDFSNIQKKHSSSLFSNQIQQELQMKTLRNLQLMDYKNQMVERNSVHTNFKQKF